MWAYARYVAAPSLMRYGFVACFFGLSLLSKPMLVTLPFALLLLDLWPLKRFWIEGSDSIQNPRLGSLFLEKLPLLAMSAASSVVTFRAQHAGGAVTDIDVWPISQRLANAIVAYVGYLNKAFWPVDLAVMYPLPGHTSVAKTVLAILLVVGITIGVGAHLRKWPWLAMGWLWFLGMLVPVIGLVQVGTQAMADRYMYLPAIGLFVIIGWCAAEIAVRWSKQGWIAGASIISVAICMAITERQLGYWQNSESLFRHALAVTK